MRACTECGDTMREVSYADGSLKRTMYWCGWCATEHSETTPLDPPVSAVMAGPPDFRGIVKLEQTRIGPHGGRIHKRLW